MGEKISHLEISGHNGEVVPNRFYRQDDSATSHLGIIFPGYGYNVDMPLLHYVRHALLDRSADVLSVAYDYTTSSFRDLPDEERTVRFTTDVAAAFDAGVGQRAYQRITLVGKSMGTLALVWLLANRERARTASLLWLTPLIQDERLRRAVASLERAGLFVIGTEDQYYDPKLFADVVASGNGTGLVVPSVHHGLEIDGFASASVRAMVGVIEGVEGFLDSEARSAD